MGAPFRFEIGQSVWWASFEPEEEQYPCPDCGGTGRLRVLMHDDTMVSIECDTCKRGYEGPKGYLTVYRRRPRAVNTVILGLETSAGKTVRPVEVAIRSAAKGGPHG